MKMSFAKSKIEMLQFILFVAIYLAPTGTKEIFVWFICAAIALEWVLIVVREIFKSLPIKDGDVVQLKSGGPLMVAEEMDAQLGWWCHWMDESGKRQSMHFRAQMLHLA